jgi:hypothetical protein
VDRLRVSKVNGAEGPAGDGARGERERPDGNPEEEDDLVSLAQFHTGETQAVKALRVSSLDSFRRTPAPSFSVENRLVRRKIFFMLNFVRWVCAFAAMAVFANCTSSGDGHRPGVYRGGQYYGDAWHATALKSQ